MLGHTYLLLGRTWLICYAALVLLLLLLLANLRALRFTSLFAVLGALAFVTLIVSLSVHHEEDESASPKGGVWPSSATDVVRALPILFFVFTFTINLLPIYSELARPTVGRIGSVCAIALALASTMYALFGTFGYELFRNRTNPNFLSNLSRANHLLPGVTIDLLKLAFGVGTMLSIPLFASECRDMLDLLLFPTSTSTPMRRAVESLLVVAAVLAIAVVSMDTSLLVRAVGATTGVMLSQTLPAAILMCALRKPWLSVARISLLLYVLGTLAMAGACAVYVWQDAVATWRGV